MDIELVTDPYACMVYIVSPLAGVGGILWRPPAYSLLALHCRQTVNLFEALVVSDIIWIYCVPL